MADRTVTYRLSADIAGFKAQMAQASASVKTAADRMTGATKEGAKFRQGLDTIGGAAGKVGLVAAAGLGAAVVSAANFDQSMSSVQAATMESAENMAQLRDAAIQAGANTAFSATEAAAGIENLAKAGVATNDILAGGLNGALDLAAAGSMEVADAAEIAATAMTQFGIAGTEVPHVADLLAAAAGKAQGEVSDFGMALKQSGLVADQVGLSIEETTGGLAAFAAAGLLGSDAGTSFKTMLGALTPNSEKAASEMERLGINAYDAQGNFVGLAEFAGNLQSALADLSNEQRQAAMETIFGSDAVRAASILYDQGESGVRDWIAAVDDQGYAADTASTKLDNLKGDLEALGGSLETALIGTGEGSTGALRELVQGTTDLINAFNDLPGPAKTATAALLGITAVTGGGLWLGSKVVRGIADTREALDQLGPAGTKAAAGLRALSVAGAVVGGVIALDAAIDGLLKTMREAPAGTEKMTGQLISLADGQLDALGETFRNLGDDIDFLKSESSGMDGALSWIPNITGLLPGENAEEQFERVTEQVAALDSALANLVASGNAEVASKALENLGLSDSQLDTLLGQMPQYEESLANVANEAKLAGDGAREGAAGVDEFGEAASDATSKVRGFKSELEALNGFLDKRAAFRNYEAAIDDLSDALERNGVNFDRNTAKGRENEAALDNMISTAAQVASNLKGVARVRFIDNSVDQLRQLGRELGIPKPIINDLIGRLRDLGAQDPEVDVDVNTGQADRAINAITGRLQGLDGNVYTTYVDTIHQTHYRRPEGGRYTVDADGGIHVNGVKQFADGGYGMDGRYYSRVPQIVQGGANILWGEEETGREAYISAKAGMEARNVEILSQAASWFGLGVHRMAADGAVTGRSSGGSPGVAPSFLSDRDVRRIAAAVAEGARIGTSESYSNDSSFRGALASQGVR